MEEREEALKPEEAEVEESMTENRMTEEPKTEVPMTEEPTSEKQKTEVPGSKEQEIVLVSEDELPRIDLDFDFMQEEKQEEELDDAMLANISSKLASEVKGEYDIEAEKSSPKRFPLPLFIGIISVLLLLLLMFYFLGTDKGRGQLARTGFGKKLIAITGGKIFEENTNYDSGNNNSTPVEGENQMPGGDVTPDDAESGKGTNPGETNQPEGPDTDNSENTETDEVPSEDLITPTPPEEIVELPRSVYHFLLLGIEEEASDGDILKTDMMMLASMDTNSGKFHFTTILRDLFVQVPGYGDMVVSDIYSLYGIQTLYDSVEKNLGIRPDGYLLIDYNGFRDVIDMLGGVNVTLTAKEAAYLNKTNYISLPENRNVKEGSLLLNGDQTLGYCRIRFVETAENEKNDLGRTSRQKRVLNQIFDRLAEKDTDSAYKVIKKCLSYITTDITGSMCQDYLEKALTMPTFIYENHCFPAEGTYETGVIRKTSVLIADMAENRELLNRYWSE